MKALYRIAINDTVDLHTRYEVARVMQLLRKPAKKRKKRDYKAEYQRRREIYG